MAAVWSLRALQARCHWSWHGETGCLVMNAAAVRMPKTRGLANAFMPTAGSSIIRALQHRASTERKDHTQKIFFAEESAPFTPRFSLRKATQMFRNAHRLAALRNRLDPWLMEHAELSAGTHWLSAGFARRFHCWFNERK